ncbi:MAG: hypothetical protein GZ089_01790 [Aromatoleum sp.]|nr:hypothetical protein [Aromatoleum sp.]
MRRRCHRWFAFALMALAARASVTHAGINAWTTTGPRGGWTFLAADPTVAGRVFAGREGGLYRSLDDARTWSRIDVAVPGQPGPVPNPSAMAWDPTAPNTLYSAFGGTQLWKSVDGGVTWAALPAAVPCCAGIAIGFDRIAVSAGAARRLYALVFGGGVYTSGDDGASWGPNTSGPGNDLALDPFRPASVYFASAGGGQFFRSDDAGATWPQVSVGLDPSLHFAAIAADPVVADRVYAVGDIFGTGESAALYVSENRGVTWTRRSALPGPGPSYPRLLVIERSRPKVMTVLAQTGLFRSDDAGTTWSTLWLTRGDAVQSFAVSPSGETLYAGGSVDGVQRSADAGLTWEPRNAGLPGDRVQRLAAGGNPRFGYLTGGRTFWTVASRLYERAAGANIWNDRFALPAPYSPPFGSLAALADAHRSPGSGVPLWYLLGDGNGIARTDESGAWQALTRLPSANYDKFVASPSDPTILYVAGPSAFGRYSQIPGGLAVSQDGGQSWLDRSAAFADAPNAYLNYDAIAVDPQQGTTVWLGVGAGLWRSGDSGATWGEIAFFADVPDVTAGTIRAIDIDPADSRRMVVAGPLGQRVRESADGGATWTSLEAGLSDGEPRAAVVDWSMQPRVIYVGTQHGVYANTTAGSWTLVPGSSTLTVNALQLGRPPGVTDRTTLIAATDTGVHEFTADPTGRFVPVYRFFNTLTSTHFYTASAVERAYVLAHYPSFLDEGTAFWALAANAARAKPVFRFFNTVTGTHFYTIDVAERDHVLATYPQFVFEAIAYYAFDDSEPGTVPAHRFFNTVTGTHFYTSSDDEVLYVRQHFPQFVYEGIRYAVYPAALAQ